MGKGTKTRQPYDCEVVETFKARADKRRELKSYMFQSIAIETLVADAAAFGTFFALPQP